MSTTVKQLVAAAPIFHVAQIDDTLSFYQTKLGFSLRWRNLNYACIERDGVELHLFAANTAADAARRSQSESSASDLYVFVNDVDTLYAEFKSRGAAVYDEPKDYPYGMRDFSLRDIDGHVLTFGHEV